MRGKVELRKLDKLATFKSTDIMPRREEEMVLFTKRKRTEKGREGSRRKSIKQ